ncbi:unnamed protein product, partial [Brenthis ino]
MSHGGSTSPMRDLDATVRDAPWSAALAHVTGARTTFEKSKTTINTICDTQRIDAKIRSDHRNTSLYNKSIKIIKVKGAGPRNLFVVFMYA